VQAREDAFHNANGRDEEESILKDDSPFNRAITNLQQDIELNTNPRLAGDVEFIHILGLASLTATIADHGVLLGKISDKDLAAESYCEVFAMESVKSGVLQEDECLKAVDGQQDTNEKATDDPHSQFQQLRDDLTHQGHAVPSSDTNGSAQPQKENISGEVAMGLLFNKTVPVYPPIAKAARVSGTVVLEATISKTGVIEDLHVISGPAMLIQAALDAVRTWQYRPYLVNGEPVEVETTVNVVFTLGG
jgi:TonB family protein